MPVEADRSIPKGLPKGLGILMLSFLILCASSFSFSRFFGNRIAVRILLPLTLRECDGVRGGRGAWSSCFLEKLNLRVCTAGVDDTGLVGCGFGGGSGLETSVGEVGDVMGVEDAIVPPTPDLDTDELILRGAFRVIEHGVGGMPVVGVMRAGLCGEPIAMTNGILDAEATLSLRSGGGDD